MWCAQAWLAGKGLSWDLNPAWPESGAWALHCATLSVLHVGNLPGGRKDRFMLHFGGLQVTLGENEMGQLLPSSFLVLPSPGLGPLPFWDAAELGSGLLPYWGHKLLDCGQLPPKLTLLPSWLGSAAQMRPLHRHPWGTWISLSMCILEWKWAGTSKNNYHVLLWPVWLSWLGIVLQTERLQVWFLVRAHTRVAGWVPGWGTYERQPVNVSLSHQCFSPSLSLFLK